MYAIRPEAESEPDIWHALADPTRRLLIDRLAGGARTTSQLCENMPMSRFGVMKHLGILERAGLVVARRHGRLRLNHLNAAPLRALVAGWLSPRAEALAAGAARFAEHLEEGAMAEEMKAQAQQAGVVDVALEWPVAAPVQRVWKALFDQPQSWWPAAHRAVGGDAVMRLEAKLGGQLREEAPGGGGLVWYQVIAIDPMRSVDLAGHLATRYGGPASSLLHLEIVPGPDEGSSILKLTDSVFGRIGPGLRASLTSGWQAIVGEGLVAFASEEPGS
ncbi:MAG TPA: helix-turn-helix domain-containing protein [Allosphingosinicella sp.]|nr:helix-turn-helix domain-containing protein [Allosphingosinicella sp.]